MTVCPICNGAVSEKDGVPFCTNCQQNVDAVKGNPYQRIVPQRGERDQFFGPKDTVLNPATPLARAAQSMDHLKRNKKNPDLAEHNKDTVKEVFISEPIHQCANPKDKIRRNVDIDKEEVWRSCEDLAIDG